MLGDVREELADPDAALAVLRETSTATASRLPVAANCTRGLSNGSGLPSSRASSGL